nr:translation initiation factor IF-2-like [Anser cygnoides]
MTDNNPPPHHHPGARGAAVNGPNARVGARGSPAPPLRRPSRAPRSAPLPRGRSAATQRLGGGGGRRKEAEEGPRVAALAPAAAGLSRERGAGSVPGWWEPAEKAGAAAGTGLRRRPRTGLRAADPRRQAAPGPAARAYSRNFRGVERVPGDANFIAALFLR